MNSLDLYEFSDPVVPERDGANAEASSSLASSSQPSLNEEVSQVIGQLGRFWGGVRKQSQTAFESARKDLTQVVSQAQKEIEKLGQSQTLPREEQSLSDGAGEKGTEQADTTPATSDAASETSVSTAAPSSESLPSAPLTSSTFFSRLQSSLPPNLTPTALSSTLQRHLPENLQHGLNLENATADFTQLRATLAENIQRVQQGTTVQQAEKLAEQYMHKGEALIKEAGEFLKDAVKVVPPEDGASGSAGVVWDGSDVWPLPAAIQTNVTQGVSRKGKGKESEVLFSVPRAAAKRTDVLLRKLRSDPGIIRRDPESDEDVAVKDLWRSFVKGEVDANGGITSEAWMLRTSAALERHDEDEDAKTLIVMRDQLVPAELTNDVFWTRYFFRVHQIEREEERRKALLEGARQEEDDDDFTWEDEDEDDADEGDNASAKVAEETPVNTMGPFLAPPDADVSVNTGSVTDVPSAPSNAPSSISQTPISLSPRESEDSYDVVSSGISSAGGRTNENKPKGSAKGEDDGEDSDWE